MQSFEVNKKTIVEAIFSLDKKFQIPPYQRAYSRGQDEARELWEDINSSQDGYFIGSFIFNNQNKNSNGRIDIIDGQQRSLTFTILFAVIRDVLRYRGLNDVAGYIQENYISRNPNKLLNKVAEAYILPGESNRVFFQIKIQNGEEYYGKLTLEYKKILEVYQYFYQIITTETKTLSIEELQLKLGEYIEKIRKLLVIVIEIQDEMDAYTIFETVNGRGVDLTPSDLLKNMIFRHYDKKIGNIENAKEMWSQIESNTNDTKIIDYLRHYWRSKYNYVSNFNILNDIKRYIQIGDIVPFFEQLHNQSYIYQIISNPIKYTSDDLGLVYPLNKKNESEKIYEILLAIQKMRIKQYHPIFLSLFRNFNKIINITNPLKLLESLEKFTFAYFTMSNLPAREIEKKSCKLALDIEKECNTQLNTELLGKNLQKIFQEFTSFLRENFPSYDTFKNGFLELGYEKYDIIRYVLIKINNKLETELSKDDTHNYRLFTIEHILPKDPTNRGLTMNETKGYVNKLGNLTLLGGKTNGFVSNDKLYDKISKEKGMQSSKSILTQKLIENIQKNNYIRTEKEITERHERLCEFMYHKVCAI